MFSPKDKIGDWLEMYTKVMELNYWSSTICKKASYDDTAQEWVVEAERRGKEILLKPKQLVLATGMSGKPNMPKFKGMDVFEGDQHHSSEHPGPDKYKGKKAVVIGSNNSAHDICAALWEAGADVTMVQRSSTHIVKSRLAYGNWTWRSLFRARRQVRDDDSEGRHDLCLPAIQNPARIPNPGLQRDQGQGRRVLQAA